MASLLLNVSDRGQISLPADIRHRWQIRRVLLIDEGDAVVLRPVPDDPIDSVRGKYASLPLSSLHLRATDGQGAPPDDCSRGLPVRCSGRAGATPGELIRAGAVLRRSTAETIDRLVRQGWRHRRRADLDVLGRSAPARPSWPTGRACCATHYPAPPAH
jgi:bifunctional DNA-binding transcriptional regulator/antitoxin component of YhaV-PrlF toxin-antitoxin module